MTNVCCHPPLEGCVCTRVCLRKKALEDKDKVLIKEMCWGGECYSPPQGVGRACGASAERSAVVVCCEHGFCVESRLWTYSNGLVKSGRGWETKEVMEGAGTQV